MVAVFLTGVARLAVALGAGASVVLGSIEIGASGSGVAVAGVASGAGAGGFIVTGTGSVVVGAACADTWVEESAKTAAIAVAPARAYSVFMFFIMTDQPATRRSVAPKRQ